MSELPRPDDVVTAFERGEMILPQLDHEGHVYLAWRYLQTRSLLDAVARLPRAVRRFTEAQGAGDKYNATISVAYLLLTYERLQADPDAGWERFRRNNPDLLEWPGGALSNSYSVRVLRSVEARQELVPPDRERRT